MTIVIANVAVWNFLPELSVQNHYSYYSAVLIKYFNISILLTNRNKLDYKTKIITKTVFT